jgi:UDP-N-acetylglucosamine 2-epimerase
MKLAFDEYAIAMFHPVTTEYDNMNDYAEAYINALLQSEENYIVIYPNNDKGSEFILSELKRLEHNSKFKIFPSVRFEAFLGNDEKCKIYCRQFKCRNQRSSLLWHSNGKCWYKTKWKNC